MQPGESTHLARHDLRTDQIEQMVLDGVPQMETRLVDLGVLRFLLRTNALSFSGFDYFCRVSEPILVSNERYSITCIDLDHPHRLDDRMLHELADTSYRASRFKAGFYLSAHFGEPATLIVRGDRCYVFGRRLDRILWGWYVKYLLTAYSIESNALHLKAGCLAVQDSGALVIGRCGGGKTVFLMQTCLNGAAFISNTHTIVDASNQAHGVASMLRVREDAFLASLCASATTRAHLAADASDRILDPRSLALNYADKAKVHSICMLDYRPFVTPRIDHLSANDAYNFAEQFALAINAYGMKDDVLEMCGVDTMQFTRVYNDMKRRLRDIVSSSRCYCVSADVCDRSQHAKICQLLSMW